MASAVATRSSSNLAAPPTNEIGAVLQGVFSPAGMERFVNPLMDIWERTPELLWPNSINMFHRMRSDTQLSSLYKGTVWPIFRFKWTIDPNHAPDDMVIELSKDLNLPIEGDDAQPQRRQKRRFSFKDHQRKAFLALIYGHNYFEQYGEYENNDPSFWHLRKLAERMPHTIAAVNVADDGGLVSIKQNISRGRKAINWIDLPEIPVDRLVAYVWEQEGANWFGRSIFRDCYGPWLIKDKLMRIDAINHARAGGTPIPSAPPGATPGEISRLSQMAQEFKVGENSGGAVPYGTEFTVVRSSNTNVVDSMRYHDELMARAFLMMFMQLGQTRTGSRALSTTFVDFFKESVDTIAWWFVDVFGEHVIEDWVDWNYGEDVDVVPLLKFHSNPDLAVSDLAQLIDKRAIVVDGDLENALREEFALPRKQAGAPDPKPAQEDPVAPAGGFGGGGKPTQATRPERVAASAEGLPSLPLPDRPLRRQPFDHEIRASTDFAALDIAWQSQTGMIVMEWFSVRAAQAQEAHDAIIAAQGDMKKLSKLAVNPQGAALLISRMQAIAVQGATEAMREAGRQGIRPEMPDLTKLNKALHARASAVEEVIASSLSDAARSQAIRLTGGGMSPAEVAAQVKEYILDLSDAYLRDQLGGALAAAQNDGRRETILHNDADEIYASEILDTNTCDPCLTVDGRRYDDFDLAAKDYPTGGYRKCKGGNKCRGTLVAIYNKEEQ